MRNTPAPFPEEALPFPLPPGFFSNLPLVFHRGEGIFVPLGEKSAQSPVKPR